MADTEVALPMEGVRQVIVPRKGITELMRLLDGMDGTVVLVIGENHLQVRSPTQQMTSKLIDGKYPDYERVLPRAGDKLVVADRETLRNGLARTAILSNEKFRGVRLSLKPNNLTALAHNPEHEEAEESMEVQYDGAELEIGFNANYLLDVLQTLRSSQVRIEFSNADSSCLITPESDHAKFVVMPMRL
jgi:DNA polymerase-3 subunit beta